MYTGFRHNVLLKIIDHDAIQYIDHDAIQYIDHDAIQYIGTDHINCGPEGEFSITQKYSVRAPRDSNPYSNGGSSIQYM